MQNLKKLLGKLYSGSDELLNHVQSEENFPSRYFMLFS